MASSSNNGANDPITGINVTPLVDVVLVLLVVLMVAATYIASRAIPVELPKGATGEANAAPLTVSIDSQDNLYLDGTAISKPKLREQIRARRKDQADLKAVLAADGAVAHRNVVEVIDLLRQENVIHFAINVDPSDIDGKKH
jgi:biopolymer transport protein ExbD